MNTILHSSKIASMTIASFLTILMIASLMCGAIFTVKAQDERGQHGVVGGIGTSPLDTPGMPILGPLPPGVTPAFTFETYAYLSVSPNPIGKGQALLVNVWTSPGTMTEFYRQGNTVYIQKPDGTNETIGPFISYIGDCSAWFNYVVDQVGLWKIKFEHAGTYIPAGQYVALPGSPTLYPNFTLTSSIYYAPSSTDWQEFTVQDDLVASWPSVSLPTDYWTRPVSAENREWYAISGNYPWNGAYYYPGGRVLYSSNYKFTQYVQAPDTAHVVWRRQGNLGGLIGGDAYYSTRNVGGGNPSIIYAGRCYQSITKPMTQLVSGAYQSVQTNFLECYDLRTGQVYWDLINVPTPTNILYQFPGASNIPGAEASQTTTPYLVAISSNRLYKYDPYTGAINLNISIPTFSQNNIYNNDLVLSQQTITSGSTTSYRLINWTMSGSSTDFTTRIMSNITWPKISLAGGGNVGANAYDYNAGVAVGGGWSLGAPQGYTSYADRGVSSACYGYNVTSVDLKTGEVLFSVWANETKNTPISGSTCVADRGKVALGMEEMHWTCWDTRTGQKLWESENTGYPWGNWWAYNTASYSFNESKGAIIATGYAGVFAIDWDNGHIIWHYNASSVPFEEPYNQLPFYTGVTIADGKIYAYNSEHTPTQPITRGWALHCLNATTGNLLWRITGGMAPGGVADGYLTASNIYDGYTYVFGKGKSATTMTATPATGSGWLISGTVMDKSPGDQGSIANPTAPLDSPTAPGTIPCVNAASMTTQMEYLYMQHPIDGLYHNETITGVPVILTAIGSDGTVTDLGSVTTNGYYGTFSYLWDPPKTDTYTITATFAGDGSYGTSSAACALAQGALPATPTPTATQAPANFVTPSDLLMYLAVGIVAIIIAIAIATVLIIRRH